MAGPRLHSLLATLAGLAALALASAPAVVAFGLGWMSLGWSSGTDSIGHLIDGNSIEAWTLLALAFLVWVPMVLAGLIVVLDRLGRPYTPPEREARPTKAARRRQRAGLGYMAARRAPAAPKARPARPQTKAAAPTSRPAPPATSDGGAPAAPRSGRGDA